MGKTSEGDLTEILAIRVSPGDISLLDHVTELHAFAKRGAIAREALRRGLTAMKEDVKEVKKKKR